MKIKETVQIEDSIFDLVNIFDPISVEGSILGGLDALSFSVSKIWLENVFDEDSNEYVEKINGALILNNCSEVRLIKKDGTSIRKTDIEFCVIRQDRKNLIESLKFNLENHGLSERADYYINKINNGGFAHLTISDNYRSDIECRLILIDKLFDKLLYSIKNKTLSNLSFAIQFVNVYKERKTEDNAVMYDMYKLEDEVCVIADNNTIGSLFGVIDGIFFVENSITLIADELKNDDEDLTDDEKIERLSFFDKTVIQLLNDTKHIVHRGALILLIILIVVIIAVLFS